MAEKIQLDQSEMPPQCPHCQETLTTMHWHKVQGGPWALRYIAIMSCPHCRKALGAIGS